MLTAMFQSLISNLTMPTIAPSSLPTFSPRMACGFSLRGFQQVVRLPPERSLPSRRSPGLFGPYTVANSACCPLTAPAPAYATPESYL